MDERLQFVARRLAGEQLADLCREFGISLNPFVSREIARISVFWICFVLACFVRHLVTIC